MLVSSRSAAGLRHCKGGCFTDLISRPVSRADWIEYIGSFGFLMVEQAPDVAVKLFWFQHQRLRIPNH